MLATSALSPRPSLALAPLPPRDFAPSPSRPRPACVLLLLRLCALALLCWLSRAHRPHLSAFMLTRALSAFLLLRALALAPSRHSPFLSCTYASAPSTPSPSAFLLLRAPPRAPPLAPPLPSRAVCVSSGDAESPAPSLPFFCFVRLLALAPSCPSPFLSCMRQLRPVDADALIFP